MTKDEYAGRHPYRIMDGFVPTEASNTDAVAGAGPVLGLGRSEQQRAVAQWFQKNGGHTNIFKATNRAQKEFAELIAALQSGDISHAREEMADVVLCLMLAAEYGGFDLLEAVSWKQGINDVRKWAVDELGCLSHVKGSDPREALADDSCQSVHGGHQDSDWNRK